MKLIAEVELDLFMGRVVYSGSKAHLKLGGFE